jgi:pectate lyase
MNIGYRLTLVALFALAMISQARAVSPNPKYNLTGFATLGTPVTGGGIIGESDPGYRKVSTPLEFADALANANKNKGVKVIEIMNDLDLGWNEVGTAVQTLASTPFSSAAAPKLHPVLKQTGVSSITVNPKNGGLTIFSNNGSTIRHASLNLKATKNIIIRNLKFDGLWEWDEESKGKYDKNNWDFITLGVGGGTVDHVWVDHCTFTKAYDGIIDTKGGASNITYSWNKFAGDDGATNPNSFVRQQIDALEANKAAYPMYNFLRTRGYSVENIVEIMQGPNKVQAIGELSLEPVNVNSTVTFHHQWYVNAWDRLPRLAGGMVHNYNIYVDNEGVLDARRLRDEIASTLSAADQNTLNNTYSFKPPINGSISTENGSMFIEKSVYTDTLYPLRNNQTDPNNPTYTGKIMAEDTIYSFRETNGQTTVVRGNSTDPGNLLGPFQAPIIPFSWNTADGNRPYPAPQMDDPADLAAIVTNPTSGAGAGVLQWDKVNWLKTIYEPIALLPGDFNANGVVGAEDYVVWRDNFGAPAGTLPNDTDGGAIGLNQYATWKAHFGTTSGSGASNTSSIPEPCSIGLVSLTVSILLPTLRARSISR